MEARTLLDAHGELVKIAGLLQESGRYANGPDFALDAALDTVSEALMERVRYWRDDDYARQVDGE